MDEMPNRFKPAPLARYFFAIASTCKTYHQATESLLAEEFGELGTRSQIYDFSEFSHYYDREMGGPVWKYFVSVQELFPADRIVECKHFAEDLQQEMMLRDSNRTIRSVNIDPGYINGWQVVLSTVKNCGHRIYLDKGVFVEITLLYRKKRFEAFPWSYPDYQSPTVQEYFYQLKREFEAQIHSG